MKWYYKLERKFGKYAVPDLMRYIVALYAVGFVIYVFFGDFYEQYLSLNANAILHGQIWRVVTFILRPPSTSIIWIFFSLYFYYLLGNVLERAWGTFRFNLYYVSGMIFHVIAALVIYLVFHMNFSFDAYYLNLSLFLAFATIMPEAEVRLMFIIPIKVKWIAYLDMLMLGATIVFGFMMNFINPQSAISLYYKLASVGIFATPIYATAALISILNFFIFYATTSNFKRMSPKEVKRRAQYQHKIRKSATGNKHKCAVCGRTEEDDENLEFRFCSKCQGNFEYCSEHLYTHKHVGGENSSDSKDENNKVYL